MIFWRWFTVGALAAALSADFVLGRVAGIGSVLSVLATPGVLLSLPLHNLLGAGWQVVTAIALINGLFYGLVALGASRRGRRPPEW